MDSVLRKFGIRKVDAKETDARVKLQKDLFRFQQGSDHGYPRMVSTMSYSAHLDMIAIGTKDGFLKIYGSPGVYYSSQQANNEAIEQVFFIGEACRVITYTDNNTLHLWTSPPQATSLKCLCSLNLQSKINNPSAFTVSRNNLHLFIGAENGNIYSVSIDNLQLSTMAIYRENVLKNYFEENRSDQGKVVAIRQLEKDKFLIAYECSLIAVYNVRTKTSLDFFETHQRLESLHLQSSAKEFITSHSNGTYSIWKLDNNHTTNKNNKINNGDSTDNGGNNNKENNNENSNQNSHHNHNVKKKAVTTTPYGPFPCKAIKKIVWLKRPPFKHPSRSSPKPPRHHKDTTMTHHHKDTTKDLKVPMKSQDTAFDRSNKGGGGGDGGNGSENGSEDAGEHSDMFIFSGGMPRSSFGEKQTVSVMHGKRHVVFDVSSKVLDFEVVVKHGGEEKEEEEEEEEVIALLILAEQEFIAIDLTSLNWPCYQLPYLANLHSSALTCLQVLEDVDDVTISHLQTPHHRSALFSHQTWPIQGKSSQTDDSTIPTKQVILLTGHEDGSVKLWRVSRPSEVLLLAQFHTSKLFETSAYDGAEEEEEEGGLGDDGSICGWPPFRKTGTYDPYSDDPRLAVRKVDLCLSSGFLVVAGTAGQVVVAKAVVADEEEREQGSPNETLGKSCEDALGKMSRRPTRKVSGGTTGESLEEAARWMRPVRLSFIDERTRNFVWKGHEVLPLRKPPLDGAFKPLYVVQAFPPAAITSICLCPQWGLLAVGTAHGFGLVDVLQGKLVELKTTFNSADLSGVHDASMSRRKSFKKSLRESFRRLKSRRSEHNKKNVEPKKNGGVTSQNTTIEMDTPKPIERAVEARSLDDATASIVRCLYFAETHLVQANSLTATFWAGTNAGMVYIYQLVVPHLSERLSDEVISSLAKEVHLRHHAPVVSINVVERPGVGTDKGTDIPSHAVVICSEEQIKLFQLPSLSAKEKYKLTAHEGTKIRKSTMARFVSSSGDVDYSETCLVCTTNSGESHVYSIPLLRRQLKVDSIKKDNILGMVSCQLTAKGSAYYAKSPSEVSMHSFSAHRCLLNLL